MKKLLTYDLLIRLGLGVIFLANSLAAFFAPSEFIELIEQSFVAGLLPVSPELFVPLVIGINDGIVGLLLFFGFKTRFVAVWAFIWLVGVMLVIGIGSPFDVLEHAGLLFMALALIVGGNHVAKTIENKQNK